MKKITNRTNITKHIHPHLFRHSLAMNMLNRGAHLLTIKSQLGHEYIGSTLVYLRGENKRSSAEYNLYCPSYS
ncbi:MAG: tyrosine-type recombinase/integrase [Bacilli bacterium]